MYTKYNYTYKSMLFVLYSYTYKSMLFVLYSYVCMYTKYNNTYKSMLFVKILKGEDYEITHSGRLKMFVKNHKRFVIE